MTIDITEDWKLREYLDDAIDDVISDHLQEILDMFEDEIMERYNADVDLYEKTFGEEDEYASETYTGDDEASDNWVDDLGDYDIGAYNPDERI